MRAKFPAGAVTEAVASSQSNPLIRLDLTAQLISHRHEFAGLALSLTATE
jgi:hypothetical protein